MKRILILALAAVWLSYGCASDGAKVTKANQQPAPMSGGGMTGGGVVLDSDRFGEESLAQGLKDNLRVRDYANYPVVVTTFVDLNDLENSSVFGRVMAEKLMHHLNTNGFHVVEVRRAQDLFIKKQVGELILTRDAAELNRRAKARSVVAGTYVATMNALIVNARLVDIRSPQVISTFSYELPMTEELESLLRGEAPY